MTHVTPFSASSSLLEMAPSAGQRLLREHLQRDAPAREASVARFMAVAAGGSGVASCALVPLIGPRLGVSLALLLFGLTLYYAVLGRALSRGWFHRAVPWVNAALEVSMPSVIFTVDLSLRGPEYALTAPPLAIWGTLVALSALRGNRALAVGAGLLAASEYLALYFVLARPHLGASPLVTFEPPLMVTRALLLASAGVVTAVFVTHFNRRAVEAFAAVRERDLFGKYLLNERIGAGGMAEVFRATYSPEGGFEKVVAVKRILPGYTEDERFLEMFRGEAELCSRLNHPNIVQVFDFGKHGDTYYLAMEYVDGLSLRRVLDALPGRALPLSAVTFLGVELAEALDYLYRRVGPDGSPLNLVHRDLNPPNVLLSALGEVKLADFGIARAASRAQVTIAGTMKGKPGYFAPEQLTEDRLDGRVDLFALGITLFEAGTGRNLFPTADDDTSLLAPITQDIPRPSLVRSELPPDLERVILGLLERRPGDRIAAREVVSRLRALTGAAAPFPDGHAELARAVRFAQSERARVNAKPSTASAEAATQIVEDPTTKSSHRGKSAP